MFCDQTTVRAIYAMKSAKHCITLPLMQMSLICDTKKQKMQSTWNESYSEKLNSSNIQIHIDGGDSNRCEFATFNQKKCIEV